MGSDTDFTAEGPTLIGFLTMGANIGTGGQLVGTRNGVVCISGETPSGSVVPQDVGAWSLGDSIGVYGRTREPGPDLGFLSVVPGSGVFGTSKVTPGVAGTSLTSAGVVGQSGDAAQQGPTAGVVGTSQQAAAVARLVEARLKIR